MFNISRSTHSKNSIFEMHMDILTTFQLSGKIFSWSLRERNIEELPPKTMSFKFLKRTFGLTEATK